MKNGSLLLSFLLAISIVTNAENKDSVQSPLLVFEIPVFDLSYQFDAAKTVNNGNASFGSFFKGYANPGMHQSLNLSTDLYTGLHYGIDKLFKSENNIKRKEKPFVKRLLHYLTFCTADYLAMYAPGFNGWLHEEYHRSVMTRFHVNSFDNMNKFPIGALTTNVSHVIDADLIRFKKESPFDFNRMHVAGIEGEYLLIDQLQRNNFYYNQHLFHELIYLLSTVNSIQYVQICSIPKQADVMTDGLNAKEKDIRVRDFTGLDFTGWAYDLFKPDEPYTGRGVHPLGNGIDRYIKTTDLTSEELSYLKKQGKLQWLNVISPMMIGIQIIKMTKNGLYGNFAVRNFLTSFGNDISCNFYLKNHNDNLFFAYHSSQNYQRSFPAIEAQLIDYKKAIGSYSLYFSPRLLVGMQPLEQGFKTSKAAFLALAECKVEMETKSFIHPYIEFSAKTKGWVAGNEFLNSNLSCRVGVISRLNK
jgi:hypothetical protein